MRKRSDDVASDDVARVHMTASLRLHVTASEGRRDPLAPAVLGHSQWALCEFSGGDRLYEHTLVDLPGIEMNTYLYRKILPHLSGKTKFELTGLYGSSTHAAEILVS
jgi:hypothetical protein